MFKKEWVVILLVWKDWFFGFCVAFKTSNLQERIIDEKRDSWAGMSTAIISGIL